MNIIIRVAFFLDYNENWLGGINYYNNLFKNLDKYGNGILKIIVFTNNYTAKLLVKEHHDNIEVIVDNLFERKSLKWFIKMSMHKLLHNDYLINRLLIKYNIDIVSHLGSVIYNSKIRNLGWIPDFQHIYLPEFFSKKEIEIRNINFKEMMSLCDGIIFSSYDAKNDAMEFSETHNSKIKSSHVLQFAVDEFDSNKIIDIELLREKFSFDGDFFFLPNQFWVHKNHKIVLEALVEIKKLEKNILIIATGNKMDYRNKNHFSFIEEFILKNGLKKMFKILGKINHVEVMSLMYHSRAVINPSLFEGWSTTVEESKMMNKLLLLSSIDVHHEQKPENVIFFDPYDFKSLSNILIDISENYPSLNFSSYSYYREKVVYDYESIIKKILDLNIM